MMEIQQVRIQENRFVGGAIAPPFLQTDRDSCFTIRFKHVTIFFMQLVFEVR